MLKHKFGLILLLLLVATAFVGSLGRAQAADTLQAVAESYSTATPLQQGMIVQLDDKNKKAVTAATYNDTKKMFGVTVASSETPVSISSDSDKQQAYVVTAGRYSVLVSDQNGAIEPGDFISVSAIDGIGMQADSAQDTVLGRAVGSFDGKEHVISKSSLKLKDGSDSEAAIGSVVVDVAIRGNPAFNGSGGIPGILQNLAMSVGGKPVNSLQLYSSIAILLIGLAVVTILIYSGVQTSMVALGRNPLAKQSIMRNMFQVIITGTLIFLGCLVAVYLILNI